MFNCYAFSLLLILEMKKLEKKGIKISQESFKKATDFKNLHKYQHLNVKDCANLLAFNVILY